MPNLAGLHDREGHVIAPPDTWIVDTIALSENPQPTNHVGSLHWIGRLNWGYGTTGTLPVPDQYPMFAQRVAAYVAASQGCHIWVIGNEPNLPREWPDGQPIYPGQYAECYKLCRDAIHALPGHANDEVLIAGPGPWNPATKYAGNLRGDWVQYLADVIAALGPSGFDGVALHSYTHGYNITLVTSEAGMDAPFQDRRYEFRAYRDFMAVIPPRKRVYITEANGNGRWQAVGLMLAMLEEINDWNQAHPDQPIMCVAFYRYPKYDENAQFAIEGKDDVIAEYRAACALGYQSPEVGAVIPTQEPEQTFMPKISIGVDNSTPTLPKREISEEFKRRVPRVDLLPATRTLPYYRLIKAEYVPDGARRFGPDHHILVEVLDANGQRKMGVPVRFYWGSGYTDVPTNKADGPYAADYGMTSAGHSFGVFVESDAKSDIVFGMGLGKIGSEHMGDHVTYYLVFQEVFPTAQPQPSIPQPQPTPPAKVPVLVHPVADPQYRRFTQSFGARPDYYKQYTVDGVPLKGHEGIDFGTPTGSWIVAVDAGRVVEVADQGDKGYGRYIKIVHAWGESVYAHLQDFMVDLGQNVHAGEIIGDSGWTGNVDPKGPAGAHLHFGMRVNPFNRKDGWGGYTDPAPYLINTGTPQPVDAGPFIPTQPAPPAGKQPPARQRYSKWFRQYGTQYAVDWHLLAALAYNENKFEIEPVSHKGALGLMQFMPNTWADMQREIGVTDILDPEQSIKAAAYYLAQIRSYLIKHRKFGLDWMLAGYNVGMGYARDAVNWEKVPPETQRWVDLIKETSEALRRWEDGW